MHDVVLTVLVAAGAFIGTMVDNFIAYAAQLSVTDPSRHFRAGVGQFCGLVALILLAVTVGSALEGIPIRWVGILAVAPLGLAIHAWRHRKDPVRVVRRGAITTFLVMVAFGGDNLAVWIPIYGTGSVSHGLITTGVFLVLDLGVLALARAIASHPRVLAAGQRWAPTVTPFLYATLAVVIVWECHWF